MVASPVLKTRGRLSSGQWQSKSGQRIAGGDDIDYAG